MDVSVVRTHTSSYQAIVARGCLEQLRDHIPVSAGKLFVVTSADVWELHGAAVRPALVDHPSDVLFFPGGEARKRIAEVETLAEQMVAGGADRGSVVITLGGGIVTDLGGFLAAIFMRGIPVIQIPTTLLAQVDAAIGGKTGANLVAGKNLIGCFHQPLVVLIDPQLLDTLSDNEYRAGLYEIVKCGIIADPELFRVMRHESAAVLARQPKVVDSIIASSVRLKAHVVSEDEKEGGLRRILNFGHTFGHALEAETRYTRFLHGEAVAFGMKAAIRLAELEKILPEADAREMLTCIDAYGPLPTRNGVTAASLVDRLVSDKKTVRGRVHFVLPEAIGRVLVTADVSERNVLAAIEFALAA